MKTVSLEIAKRLKEAGFPETAERHYAIGYLSGHVNLRSQSIGPDKDFFDCYAAPDVSDLLEALPTDTHLQKIGEESYLASDLRYYPVRKFDAVNPADALALLWLELNKKV